MKKKDFVHLYSAEGEKLGEEPWSIYPRPQMKRDSFFSLNGKWEFSCKNGEWESITVPFPPESLLSGICRDMGREPDLFYRKKFSLPHGFLKDRVLLHFGAADQIAEVCLNGKLLGTHRGGYLPFSFDITEYLQEENILSVHIRDELFSHVLPYGKQSLSRGGMWYTPVSGIWQSVWLESLPQNHIQGIHIDIIDDSTVDISFNGVSDGHITVKTPSGDILKKIENGHALIKIDNPLKWSPDSPYLYSFEAVSGEDKIESYFALRTLSTKIINGIPRLCLNGKPFFFHALLDQGYYSDGIYTPATPKCYEDDILAAKALGFNTLRKHIKIEPEIFYYYCDLHGIVVFQDMVNNGKYSFIRDTALPTVIERIKHVSDKNMHRNKITRTEFETAMCDTVNHLYNHPCICYWTIFNEGWGQFAGAEMYKRLKEIDNSRFIDTASGWFSDVPSDIDSPHVYFKPIKIKLNKQKKPIVVSEFGGYSHQPKGHIFNDSNEYGYRCFKECKDFENALRALYMDEIIPAISSGLCGSVYTQLSDVEDETNGLLSYDRRICKVSSDMMLDISHRIHEEIAKL